MGLKKTLTENLGVKLIAIFVALFIWFNASGHQEVVWLKMIPISLENLPDSLTVTGNVPAEVEVSIMGTKRQLMLMGFKRLNLSVDLSQSVPGRQRVSLNPRQIQLPTGFDYRNVRVHEPMSIDLLLERLITKRVKVTLSTTGAIPEDLVLLDGSLSITPSWVTILGPSSAVQHVNSVTTEALDLSRIKESFEQNIPIVFDDERFQSDPEQVKVEVRVDERWERVLANVPPTVLIDSEEFVVTIVPNTVALTVTGPRTVLDTLRSGDVSVLLNLGGLGEARYRMAPEIILPPGVELSHISVDSLTVDIVKNGP
jgi:YbbR domain-containing protein